jgi:putative MATE family efflux protein
LSSIYLKTALPIIFVMSMSGLLAVADALFLGIYVGPDALAAVTLVFPIYMLIVALATLVGSGMSSLLARHLGANAIPQAHATFTGAHGLAILLGLLLIALFFLFGRPLSYLLASGSEPLAEMGLLYLRITILFSPLLFVLSVNSDALRNEGRVGFMAAMSLFVSLANIALNYVLIAVLEMGVAGSALGTAAAQALAFAIILIFRFIGNTTLRPSVLLEHSFFAHWGRILALGAPQSLNFIGLALGSAAIIGALQWVQSPQYEDTVSAYGIIIRVLTFTFLPLLGLSHAMQTITGNNYGAELWQRSDASLRLSIWASLVYGALVQVTLMALPHEIAALFVDDTAVIAEVGRILPIMSVLMFLAGPLMVIATHFQAIGAAGKAAILGLSKPYIFALPMTFILPLWYGESGIWYAGPLSEALLLALTILVLAMSANHSTLRWGLFQTAKGART